MILDLSQYDLSTFDPQCMKAAGVTGVILGVFAPSGPEAMKGCAVACQNAGITVHGFYGLPYFGSPTGEKRDIQWAINNALQLGVTRVWIDCEIDGKGIFNDTVTPTVPGRIQVVRDLVKQIEDAGLSPGIYTAAWWWRPNMGNTHEFAHLPLWFANYGANDGTLPPYETLPDPFGGWTAPAVHQYTSTLYVCGRNRDANYLLEEEPMTPEEKAKLDAVYAALTGGVDSVITDWNKNGNSLLLGYALEQGKLADHLTSHPGGTQSLKGTTFTGVIQ